MRFAAIILLIGSIANAATITVVPSSAPNGTGSPNWNDYVANAHIALENGYSSYGFNNSRYMASYEMYPGDFTVSAFPSWHGQDTADIKRFSSERGNRIHFGLHITGDGTTFTLWDITGQITSDDPANALASSFNFFGANFNSTRKGIYYGADRIKGTADDITYTSGPGNVPLDEFNYPGLGNGFEADKEPGLTNQDKLDSVAWWCHDWLHEITGTYWVGSESASVSVDVLSPFELQSVPEPSVALISLVLLRCRRPR